MGHLVGGALVQQIAEGGVVQPLDGAALLPVRMVGDLFGIPHRLVVDVGLVAGVVLGILLRQLAVAGDLAERSEVLVVVRADQDIALLILLGVFGLRIGGLAALDDPMHAQLGVPVAPALAGDAVPAVQG